MLFTKKFYIYVIRPFNMAAFFAALFFCGYGVNTIVNGAEHPFVNASFFLKPIRMENIQSVRKNQPLTENVTIHDDLNPFAVDHKDWVVARNVQKDTSAQDIQLNLEVNGIVTIGKRTKAIVRDLDQPGSGSFWVSKGDTFKAYTVVYISKHHIILTKDGENIQFSLKKGKGKLYKGKGQIFVAPDIDLYLEKLQAQEKGEPSQLDTILKKDQLTPEEKEIAGSNNKKNKRTASGSLSSDTGVQPKTTSGGGGSGGGSQSQTTQTDEMAFIQELMKIFGKSE